MIIIYDNLSLMFDIVLSIYIYIICLIFLKNYETLDINLLKRLGMSWPPS